MYFCNVLSKQSYTKTRNKPSNIHEILIQDYNTEHATNPRCKWYEKEFSELRPVSTQENKHRIGLDFFPSYIIHIAGPKKLKIFQLFIIQVAVTGSSRNRKLVPKAHARVKFCSDPMLIFLSGNQPLISPLI